jgi:EKC/KEOPS complex subunit CGI121/TPRKB
MVETIHLAHMPPELALHVAMYTDVENASFLKDQLLAGNAEFEYAFIDASMVRCPFPNFPTSQSPIILPLHTSLTVVYSWVFQILSTKHVLAAAFRAMNDHLNERLKSRNIHSEIVFCLSPNNNVRLSPVTPGRICPLVVVFVFVVVAVGRRRFVL